MGRKTAVVAVPRYAVYVVAAAVFLRAFGTAGVLPFRFTRQPVLFAGLGIEFLQESLHVIPAYLLHRAGISAVAKVAGVVAHDSLPLTLGDFGLTHGKGLGNGDAVDRFFISFAVVRAHVETARRNDDHLRAIRTVAECLVGPGCGIKRKHGNRQYDSVKPVHDLLLVKDGKICLSTRCFIPPKL